MIYYVINGVWPAYGNSINMPLCAVTVCLCACAVLVRTISILPARRWKLILSSANWLANDFLNERERRNQNVIFVWINHHYKLPLVRSQVAAIQGGLRNLCLEIQDLAFQRTIIRSLKSKRFRFLIDFLTIDLVIVWRFRWLGDAFRTVQNLV